MVLALDHGVVQCVSYHFVFTLQLRLLLMLVLFFGIWLVVHTSQLLARVKEILEEVSEFHFYEHGTLPAVLAVAVAHCEKVLVVGLADVGRQNEIVLILFVDVVYAEAFACRVGEAGYYIILYYLELLDIRIFLDNERILIVVLDAVVVVDALVLE